VNGLSYGGVIKFQEQKKMNLEEEIAGQMSKELAEHIDFEFLTDILIACGWTRIELDRFRNNRHAVDISYWCSDNVKGKWQHNGRTFIFEQQKDATWFALNWL
jgi:hypothetical protein